MTESNISGANWSTDELDLIVLDYFDMLSLEVKGQKYVKSQRNEGLQKLIGRSRGSIEFKHCNVSAVIELLGIPIIDGYKPRRNFQHALIAAVDRYLGGIGDQAPVSVPKREIVAEPTQIWIGPPPSQSPQPDVSNNEPLKRLIRKFDPAQRDARNRELGKQGEELVVRHERHSLFSAGRDDLAKKVRWVSEEDGDGAGYDIRSYDPDGTERLIEVKTTNGRARTPFFMSENERAFSEERSDAFRLMRLYDFGKKPQGFEIRPSIEDWVTLTATNYRASF